MSRGSIERKPWRFVVLWTAALGACGGEPDDLLRDAGSAVTAAPDCSPDRPCDEAGRCIDGRCVPACAGDPDCGPRERCGSEGGEKGLCVARDEAAPVDVCAGKLCLAPTPACHPLSGACVACTDETHCTSGTVCDRGRAACVAPTPALCAACGGDGDCGEGFSCLSLEEPFERVCVPVGCTDGALCPVGFACSPARGVCLPVRGSCTSYRAGLAAAPCLTSAECSAQGIAGSSVFAGVCRAQACALGCEQTPDCPGDLWCSGNVCSVPAGDAGTPDGQVDGGV